MKRFAGFGGMSFMHEQCACGKCRCEHEGGFAHSKDGKCTRYTWPGKTIEVKHEKVRSSSRKLRRPSRERGGYLGTWESIDAFESGRPMSSDDY